MPSDDEMRALGFTREDYEADPVEVWVENWPSVRFFSRLATQWRHGMSGPTGLDYTAVLALLRSLRLPRPQAEGIFEDVQVMESAALTEIHAKR